MSQPTVLITGATDGIGRQWALLLAERGYRVLAHGRDAKKLAAVVDEIKKRGGHADAVKADLARFADVRAAATRVQSLTERLDVLVLNAGVYAKRREETDDGHELCFQVNHLSQFLLTQRLVSLLVQSRPATVLVVSSIAHRNGRMDFKDLESKRAFDGYAVYGMTKLANILFARALGRRLEGQGVTANAVHPGVVSTKLLRSGFGIGGEDPEDSARRLADLVASGVLLEGSGRYYDRGSPSEASRHALSREDSERLWEISAKLTGEDAFAESASAVR